MLTVALSIKSSCPLIVKGGGVSLWTVVHPPPNTNTSIQNKANVPFHQPGLFIGFWVVSRWNPAPFTFWPSMVSLGTITAPVMLRGEWILVLQWRRSEWEVRDQTILKTILILAGSCQFSWDSVYFNICAHPLPSCLTSIDTLFP